METPRVSVAMVVCNVERFLAEAIESILEQTLREIEFIIVDFGSTDGTPAIVSRYQAKDSRIRTQTIPHCGLADARNASCTLARSPLLAIMDADDVALKDRLMWQVEFMEQHAEVGALGGAAEVIDGTGKKLGERHCPLQNEEIQAALLAYRPAFINPSLVMRKEVFQAAGGYRQAFAPADDYELWLRLAERSKLANLGATVMKYRVHPRQECYRHMHEMTVGAFAARAAAISRRKGLPDPLTAVKEITPAVLAELQVTPGEVENRLLLGYQEQIKLSVSLNFDVPLLESVGEMLATLRQSKHVQNSVAAEVWFAAALAYWSRRKFARAVAALSRAFVHHPAMAGDLARRGFRRVARLTRKNLPRPQETV